MLVEESSRNVFLFFRSVRKIAKSDCYLRHIRPSVRLSVQNYSAPTGQSFMKTDIRVLFENQMRKFKFH